MLLPAEFCRTDPVAYVVWKMHVQPISSRRENHMNKIARTARLIRVDTGDVRFLCEDAVFRVGAGSLVYLPPAAVYSTEFLDTNYASHNLFFDFMPGRAGSEEFSEVFLRTIPHRGDTDSGGEEPPRFTDVPEFSAPFTVAASDEITSAMLSLYREFQTPDGMSPFAIRALTRYLLVETVRQLRHTASAHVSLTFARIEKFVEANLHRRLSGQELSSALNYHPYYMNRIVTHYTGMSLHNYIINEKIRRAKALLAETELPLSEIAQSLAFCDASHFSRVFSTHAHITPRAFRQAARGL